MEPAARMASRHRSQHGIWQWHGDASDGERKEGHRGGWRFCLHGYFDRRSEEEDWGLRPSRCSA